MRVGARASALSIGHQSRYATTCRRGARSGAGFSWTGAPRWIRPTKRSLVAEPDRRAPVVGAQHPRGAPVAGQPARVGGEQDDVGGAGGRVQVLLVLDRVAAEHARADDQGRRAVELRRRLGPGGLLQALERPRPEHPKAPRVGQVVVRRPARELEQLVERPRVGTGSGRKALWVRRVRIAVSTSIADNLVSGRRGAAQQTPAAAITSSEAAAARARAMPGATKPPAPPGRWRLTVAGRRRSAAARARRAARRRASPPARRRPRPAVCPRRRRRLSAGACVGSAPRPAGAGPAGAARALRRRRCSAAAAGRARAIRRRRRPSEPPPRRLAPPPRAARSARRRGTAGERERLALERQQRLGGDPDRRLVARRRVAVVAVAGLAGGQVVEPLRRRSGPRRVAPGRDQALDRPGGRLRVDEPAARERAAAVAALDARR